MHFVLMEKLCILNFSTMPIMQTRVIAVQNKMLVLCRIVIFVSLLTWSALQGQWFLVDNHLLLTTNELIIMLPFFFVISRNYKQFITIVLLTQEPRMTSQKSALPIALLYQTFGHLAATGILVYLCVIQKLQNESFWVFTCITHCCLGLWCRLFVQCE